MAELMDKQAITALVMLVVIAVIAFPYLTPQGFTVASICTGRPVLSLTPNPAKVGETVAATITGLEGCGSAEISVHEGGCQGLKVGSIFCTRSSCDSAVLRNNKISDYKLYTACFDKTGSGKFFAKGERAEALLRTIYGNDFIVKSVEFTPAQPKAKISFDVKVAIANLGTGPTTSFLKYRFEISDESNSILRFSKDIVLSAVGVDGVSSTINHIELPTPGTYRVVVKLNTESIPETDKTNNVYEGTLVVI